MNEAALSWRREQYDDAFRLVAQAKCADGALDIQHRFDAFATMVRAMNEKVPY